MANVNVLTKLSLATAGAAVVALSVSGTAQAASGFSGSYAPDNWNFTNTDANGLLINNAPGSITIVGGDNSSFEFGETSYTINAADDGEVSFSWNYQTFDEQGSTFDPFFFLHNNTFEQLSVDGFPFNSIQSGTFSKFLLKGDIFGFAVRTDDNILGPAAATISNFHAPQPKPVSEPASLIGILGLGAFGVTSVRKRKQQATVKA